MTLFDDSAIRWNEQGLITAIAQDADTGRVLMLAWMNREALERTVTERVAVFYSRSRQTLWRKGETSGNTLAVQSVALDCDNDAVLLRVRPAGPACHTGAESCFFNTLLADTSFPQGAAVLPALYKLVLERRDNPQEGSYTNYLLDKGIDKIGKKIGEEAMETVIAAKNEDAAEIRYEAADLLYHLMVLLAERGVPVEDVFAELAKRHGK